MALCAFAREVRLEKSDHIRKRFPGRYSSSMPKKKSSGKRTTIKPKGDARYIRRDSKGRIKESDDVGRSLKKDREKKAKKTVRSGYGDRGDQKR
jgi:hypothetical protein